MPTPLQDYLNYYKSLSSPGYAVLVTGQWGIGKTFQVQRALESDEMYYVSLFGRQTVSEIRTAVFAEMYPKVSGLKDLSGDITEAKGGFWGLASKYIDEQLSKKVQSSGIIVFDDLERSDVPLDDLLGVINLYVEHLKCRVVVIAHHGKLGDALSARKEKIFGQEIQAEPDIEAAYAAFKKKLATDAKAFVERHSDIVIKTFQETSCHSLRILRHVIEDIGRLHGALTDEYLKHDEAMSELVATFVSFDVHIRSGALGAGDLTDRAATAMHYRMGSKGEEAGTDAPPIVQLGRKHPTLELERGLLVDEALHSIFIQGAYVPEIIAKGLEGSAHFVRPEKAPSWKIITNYYSLDDDIIERARADMERQFQERKVTGSGEMLHIFGLRFMMAESGILAQSIDGIRDECFAYIDDLKAQKQLPPRELDWRWKDEFWRSHDNYGYWGLTDVKYNSQFSEVRNYLVTARVQVLEERFPDILEELCGLMKTDAQKFLECICYTQNPTENPYADIPVFKNMETGKFVSAWLSSPPANWQTIKIALIERYSSHRLQDSLQDELSWIEDVVMKVNAEAAKLQGFAKLRMEAISLHKVEAVLSAVRTQQETDASSDE